MFCSITASLSLFVHKTTALYTLYKTETVLPLRFQYKYFLSIILFQNSEFCDKTMSEKSFLKFKCAAF